MSNRNPKSTKEEVSKWKKALRLVDVVIYSLVLLYLGELKYGDYTVATPMVLARWIFLISDNESQFFNSAFKAIGQHISYGSKWFPWTIVLFSIDTPTNNLIPIIMVIVSDGSVKRFYSLMMLHALLSVIYHTISIQSIYQRDTTAGTETETPIKGEEEKVITDYGIADGVVPNLQKDDNASENTHGQSPKMEMATITSKEIIAINTHCTNAECCNKDRAWTAGINIRRLNYRLSFTINKIDSEPITWFMKRAFTLGGKLDFKKIRIRGRNPNRSEILNDSPKKGEYLMIGDASSEKHDIDNPVYDDMIITTQLENESDTLATTLMTKREMVDLDERFKIDNLDKTWNKTYPERVNNLKGFGGFQTPNQIRIVFKRKHDIPEPLDEVKVVSIKAEEGQNESLLEIVISTTADYETIVAKTVKTLRDKIPFIRRGLYSVNDRWLDM